MKSAYISTNQMRHSAMIVRGDRWHNYERITATSYFRLERICEALSRIGWMFGRQGATHHALIIHCQEEGGDHEQR